jgi:2-phospho-L-lactate guanylyltransferase
MMGRVEVDLVIPVKALRRAKSRLRGAAATPEEHAELVLAVLLDTVHAAGAAPGVRRMLVVSPDPMVAAALARDGVECTAEGADLGLNEALRRGEAALRDRGTSRVAALQADLPALRPEDLAGALAEAGARRAFCADRPGTGTTLLVSAPGEPLEPRFGSGSARAHAASGAMRLNGQWPGLRCDVDTADDLAVARDLGLGPRTSALLGHPCPDPSRGL